MKLRRSLPSLLVMAILIAGCEEGAKPLSGAPSPNFQVKMLDSGKVVTNQDLKGSPVLLDFWATWCPSCREFSPTVQYFSDTYGPKGLKVIGISAEYEGAVKQFHEAAHLNYPIGIDSDSSANRAFGVDAIPYVVIINKSGDVVYADNPRSQDELESIIKKLVGA